MGKPASTFSKLVEKLQPHYGLILQIAPNRYVMYAHLQNGSIKVRLHDRVHRRDELALLLSRAPLQITKGSVECSFISST